MSPNKMVAKNKPLLNNNMNGKIPIGANTNIKYQNQLPIIDMQSNFMSNTRGQFNQQNPIGWKNAKSPRSGLNEKQNLVSNPMNVPKTCFNHVGKRAEYMA